MKNLTKLFSIATLLVLSSCFEEQEFVIPDSLSYLSFETAGAEVLEGSSITNITVSIIYSGPPLTNSLSIPVSVQDGGGNPAQDGLDYTIEGGLSGVSLDAGEFETTIAISIIDNDESVGTRVLTLALGEVNGLNLGQPDLAEASSFSLNIVEDDLALLAFSSFEEVDITGVEEATYTKNGTADIRNNPGEAIVDFIATGLELGFDSQFDPDDIGDIGAEFIGLGSWPNLNLSDPADIPDFPFTYLDGKQGYHCNDVDGELEIIFDEVSFPSGVALIEISLGVFIGGFNADLDEHIELVWRTSSGDELLFRVEDTGGAIYQFTTGEDFQTGSWQTVRVNPDPTAIELTGQVVVRMRNDNDADAYVIDDLRISFVL